MLLGLLFFNLGICIKKKKEFIFIYLWLSIINIFSGYLFGLYESFFFFKGVFIV